MTVAASVGLDLTATAGRIREWGGTDTALFVGVGAIAAAIVAVGVIVAVTAFRGLGARSLAAIDTIGSNSVDLREQELDRSFTERVLEPARQAVIALGRRLMPDGQLARIRRRLDLAGNPVGWDVDRVIALQVLGAVFLAAAGGIIGVVADAGVLRSGAFVLVGLGVGWLIPTLVVYQLAATRSEKMLRDLPDSLDLLTISVESGLSFDAALSYVARNGRGPMAREFSRMLQEMQIGTGRPEALRALADRTDVAEIKSFASAMNQADAFGVPIGRALRTQADEMRVKRRQRVEEKAQKVPVKILIPLIFGILPVLFIAIIGPAAILAFRSIGGLAGGG